MINLALEIDLTGLSNKLTHKTLKADVIDRIHRFSFKPEFKM